jgi:hypothetical protein
MATKWDDTKIKGWNKVHGMEKIQIGVSIIHQTVANYSSAVVLVGSRTTKHFSF